MIPEVIVVGAGKMARAHVSVLRDIGRTFMVCGRGEQSAQAFATETGISPGTGDLAAQLGRLTAVPERAVVAVDTAEALSVTRLLMEHGVRDLLVEKPGGATVGEIRSLKNLADERRVRVNVAYNRRFLGSTLKARELIERDGGVASFTFDFTERSRHVAALDRSKIEKENWFIANSTHVVDLAFYLAGGLPASMSAATSGALEWHPSAAVFVGHGAMPEGALFSYQANWNAPGNWRVEVSTPQRRLFMQPLETLREQSWESLSAIDVAFDDAPDRRFKPGVFRQMMAFLEGENAQALCSIDDQCDALTWYEKISPPGPALDKAVAR
jgi:predicted dehydrogenase